MGEILSIEDREDRYAEFIRDVCKQRWKRYAGGQGYRR